MLSGERVTVVHRELAGTDGYRAPVYREREEAVDGVLVAPGAQADLGADRPEGVQVRYTLYFPRTFEGSLEGAAVEVRGERLEVIGHPDRYEPCPTDWNMVCEVGGTHG